MDDDTKGEFEEYYKDETGYEIISPSGYNLESEKCSGNKKSFINIKYTLDAYAKKNGLVLDPQWAVYSAEEIMQMVNNGVNIPQDIVDLANTILQTSGANVEGTDDNTDEGDNTTEKEPYLVFHHARKFDSFLWNLITFPETDEYYFYIPEGSIIQDYTVDLK